MADFRKWIYALAAVALLAGFTVPASAQNAPFQCILNAGVPPTVRAEGYTELLGDLTLNCTGGVPTPAGQTVPPVNITVSITTNLTSRLLSGSLSGVAWTEALLIIDEPHSAVNPTRNLLNCGNPGAIDNGPSGPNVCAIVSDGNPVDSYDGTVNSAATSYGGAACPVNETYPNYGCGRPNVWQGRVGSPQDPNQYNAVSWLGVPLDPPGTTTNRTIRITNIRADAHDANLAAPGNFYLSSITAQISINGNTSLSINNPQQIVAYIASGLDPSTGISNSNLAFLQCVGEHASDVGSTGPTGPLSLVPAGGQTTGTSPAFQWKEGFGSSFKAKNIAEILNEGGNGTIVAAGSYWSYDGTDLNHPIDLNQNVPGAIYNTESGFEYPGVGATLVSAPLVDPAAPNNPPLGVGTVIVPTTTGTAMTNGTDIADAGIATQGTRLQVQISNIPSGAYVLVPEAIYLNNGSGNSGVAVLVNTDASGAGTYSAVPGSGVNAGTATSTFVALQSSGLAVYEVLFADPFSIETASMAAVVSYSPDLNLNEPVPSQDAQAVGGFAPFYANSTAVHSPSSSLPVPRFISAGTAGNFFAVGKCACNLLFPFVSSQAGYDTGIAIANTSMDNLGANGASAAKAQFGGIEFWFYGTMSSGATPPGPFCTNVASPGTCPTPLATSSSSAVGQVPAGQILTYVLSSGGGSIGSGSNGLGAPAAMNGFEGYVIAQAGFQYCHAFAFITALGAGPTSAAVSEGYLGLVLDNSSFNSSGLTRTTQRGENLVH